jgi:hypothetical protein
MVRVPSGAGVASAAPEFDGRFGVFDRRLTPPQLGVDNGDAPVELHFVGPVAQLRGNHARWLQMFKRGRPVAPFEVRADYVVEAPFFHEAIAAARRKGPQGSAVAGSLLTFSGAFDPSAPTAVVFSGSGNVKAGAPALVVTSNKVVTYVPFVRNKKGQTIYRNVSVTVEQGTGKHVAKHMAFRSFQITPGSATGLAPGSVIEQTLDTANSQLNTAISDIDVMQVLSATGTNTFPLYFQLHRCSTI